MSQWVYMEFGLDRDWLFNGDLWCREPLRSRLRHRNILSLLLFCLRRQFLLVIYGARVSAERFELMWVCKRERTIEFPLYTLSGACMLVAHWECVYVHLPLETQKVCLHLWCNHSFFLSLPFFLLFSPVIVTPSSLPLLFSCFLHHSVSPMSLKTLLLSCLLLYPYSVIFFPPHPTILPPAGCKMDSPQSESSGEGQKAEESRAQGELQRGRRRSSVLGPISTFPLF